MRPVIAIFIWIILIGGLYSYMNTRESISWHPPAVVESGSTHYRIVVTTSFSAHKDPYSLQSENDPGAALLLKLNGTEILRINDLLDAGQSVAIDRIKGILIGTNEFLIEVSPAVDMIKTSGAVRVQLYRSHVELMDKTFWADPGAKVVSAFQFEVEQAPTFGNHND